VDYETGESRREGMPIERESIHFDASARRLFYSGDNALANALSEPLRLNKHQRCQNRKQYENGDALRLH
jgi:hypothetical protein